MISLAFFDVGETLLHEREPFPGVADALTAISGFETANGAGLFVGVISDYFMPSPPATEAKILALEERYRDAVLLPHGLATFFEPFAMRVTLSSRAGVPKPNRKIFETAVARAGTAATLPECLFVTETMAHLSKCAEFGITPVRFGPPTSGMAAFEDWADAPAILARLVMSGSAANQAAALAPVLSQRFGLVDFAPTATAPETITGRANQLMQLNDSRLGPLDGVYVERPIDVTVTLRQDGRIESVVDAPIDPDEVADAVNFVSTVIKSGRVAMPGQAAAPLGATHSVERDAAGRLRLLRRGYARR